MKHQIPKWLHIGVLGVFLVIFAMGFTGCASEKTVTKSDQKAAATAPLETKRITGITTEENSESVLVNVTGNQVLTYTSVKQLLPLGVVLYFPETGLDQVGSPLIPGGDIIAEVAASEMGEKAHTTRLEVTLKKDVPYEVERMGAGLKISFRKTVQASKPQPVEPEKRADVSKTTPEKKSGKTQDNIKSVSKSETKQPTKKPGKPAWVNRIDFLGEEAGKSTLVIGTTNPVTYELKKTADKKVVLKLFNAKLPSYRQRPLITTRFESAVDRIIPGETPAMKNISVVAIELREQVPYFVEQTDNLIKVHFEASTIPPKPFAEADLPSWKKVFTEAAEESMAKPGVKTERADGKPGSPDTVPLASEKRYTGEKIALDFFNTDIKNVFRILMEISGKNFAIDKDVSGKVTLTLDKPVPWDQILDLILKMNQLGQITEGDIIRIATLRTMAAEQQLEEKALETAKKADERKLELEPLITVYIPVNYASARADIVPHLTKLLSPERGKVGVDARTNLIIMTDIAEKIELAKELVRKLDRVTPQVLIEARIVEANTSFARNIGVQWGAEGGIQGTDPNAGVGPQRGYDTLGGTYGYDLAVNVPVAATGILGFNFTRLSGTPFLLNAQLMALESRGEGKIISSPKILTLDNKTAKIEQGVEIPYITTDEGGNTNTEFKNVTLTLSVTPQVTSDDRIAIKIDIQKDDVLEQTRDGIALQKKNATTELLVNDGQTVVIGGIIKTTTNTSQQGLPGLSNIPLIGWLFKSEIKSDNKEELLIFITPKVVRLKQREI